MVSWVDGAEENGVVVVVVVVTVEEEEAGVVTTTGAQAAAAPVAAECEVSSLAFEDIGWSKAMRSFSCELRESGNASSSAVVREEGGKRKQTLFLFFNGEL